MAILLLSTSFRASPPCLGGHLNLVHIPLELFTFLLFLCVMGMAILLVCPQTSLGFTYPFFLAALSEGFSVYFS